MKYSIGIIGSLALVAVLPGCGKTNTPSPIALAITDAPNCPSSTDRLWSALYREVDQRGTLASPTEIAPEIRRLAASAEHASALVGAYTQITREIRALDRDAALVRLAEMEIGDRTTEEKAVRQDELEQRLAKALSASVSALGACPTPDPSPTASPAPGGVDTTSLFQAWRDELPAPVYGAYKALSVAYQSCNAVGVSPLNASTPSVQGIVVTGTHPNGVGSTREVSDADAVYRTNPFYANRLSPLAGCFAAVSSPLIYDYGGKPYASTAGAGELDFTRNAGTGTGVLGVDCSGFVTSAVITGGLRLKVNVTSKAAQSGGVNAAMYTNPSANGLTCFGRVPSTAAQRLLAGDILANNGHIVMIDRVGADPFGVDSARTAAECDAAKSANFDFTIIQSSPSKGGIGLNRYRAKDYLAGSSTMRTALESYARSFCRVRLGLDPESTLANATNGVLVRHTGAAGCTDTSIPIVGESCLRSCGALAAMP